MRRQFGARLIWTIRHDQDKGSKGLKGSISAARGSVSSQEGQKRTNLLERDVIDRLAIYSPPRSAHEDITPSYSLEWSHVPA